jgi:peptidyl-prolyl cis-trans isomerase A (cyclophilin A)
MRTALTATTTALLALSACSSSPEPPKQQSPAPKNEPTPDVFRVNLDTSKGPVILECHRDWAPIGVDHFYTLVKLGYYDGDRFFRAVRSFVQFGISGDPKTNQLWSTAFITDDLVKESNIRGAVSYAKDGPNRRSAQLFINLRDNKTLDKQSFAPIGKIVEGMDVVDTLYSSYGEMPSRGGQGPDPSKIETEGNDYLANHFPRLDYIRKATLIPNP